MPRTKSAKKALRQAVKRRQRNLKKKQEIKKLIKLVKQSVAAADQVQAQEQLRRLYKQLDKATKTFLHPNKAARLKARLSRRVNRVLTAKS